MKLCRQCGNEIIKSNPKANNVVYCSVECRLLWQKENPTASHTKEAMDRYNHNRCNKYAPGKYKCPFCEGWYKALMRHVRQRHDMSAKEFKEHFAIRKKQSFIQDDEKDIKRESIKEHDIIPLLLENGRKTRIKKGQKIFGKRSRKTHYN